MGRLAITTAITTTRLLCSVNALVLYSVFSVFISNLLLLLSFFLATEYSFLVLVTSTCDPHIQFMNSMIFIIIIILLLLYYYYFIVYKNEILLNNKMDGLTLYIMNMCV